MAERRNVEVVEHAGKRGEVFELWEGERSLGAMWTLMVDGVEHSEKQDPGDVPMMTVRLRRFIDNELHEGDGRTR
jgi:hypothetical protein